MPHWNAVVGFATPPHLRPLRDQSAQDIERYFREVAARLGVEVLAFSWEPGKYNRRASVVVENSDEAVERLFDYFDARGRKRLKTSREKDLEAERDPADGIEPPPATGD